VKADILAHAKDSTGALYGRDVHKGVIAAVFRRDEAIALVGIEEFDGSGDHMGILCPMYDGHTPTAAHPGFEG
jgi:hypothetical protein